MSQAAQPVPFTDKVAEWLVYTSLLGLIPVLARGLVWLITDTGFDPLALPDLIAFGLVLHSANMREVNQSSGSDQRLTSRKKQYINKLCIAFICR